MTAASYLNAPMTDLDFTDLITPGRGPHVSILMPIHPAGDSRPDRITLKNLITEARTHLLERGVRGSEADDLLQSIRIAAAGTLANLNGSEGIAVYANPDGSRAVPVPFPVMPVAIVAGRFHVKPLFSLARRQGDFIVLALSHKHNRVITCAGRDAREIDVPDMPHDLEAILPERDRQTQIQTRSVPHGAALYHGQGAGKDDDATRTQRYVHRVDQAITRFLSASGTPVILAGVSGIVHAYQTASSYKHLVTESLPGNADLLSPAELHAAAQPVLQRAMFAQQRKAVEQCASLLATGHWAATPDIAAVLRNAHQRNVEAVFAAADAEVWGQWDPDDASATVSAQRAADHEDLLNLAAVMTHEQGGMVHVLPRERMPGHEMIAALLRR